MIEARDGAPSASGLKGKMEDMPTKDWVTTRLIWVVSAISTVVALVAAIQTMFLQ